MAGLYNRESLICCLFDSLFLCLNLWTILHLFVKMLSQLWELFFGKVGNTAILIPFFVLLGKNWLGMRIAVFKRLNWIFLFFKRLTWYKKIYYGTGCIDEEQILHMRHIAFGRLPCYILKCIFPAVTEPFLFVTLCHVCSLNVISD